MRKIIVLSFVSLDGVMQAPGGPGEDVSGGFEYGGWTVPFFDEFSGVQMTKQMSGDYDLLLGRKTYEIFASYWPTHTEDWPQVNTINKYVLSTTLKNPDWQNTVVLPNEEALRDLKNSTSKPLQVYGSSELVHTLMRLDMVDEIWLKTYPLILGKGKRLFDEKSMTKTFTMVDNQISPMGVIFANYKKQGEVKTGTF